LTIHGSSSWSVFRSWAGKKYRKTTGKKNEQKIEKFTAENPFQDASKENS
jgi:hypothetical protein